MEKEEVEIKEEQKQEKNTKKKKAKKEPNPFFQLLKEAWSHKRYRATIILVFWFIFLFLVAGSLRQAPESVPLTEANQTKPVSALEQFRDMTNYEFQTKLTWTEIESNTVQERALSGRRLGYQEEFDNTTDHTSYYVDNGIIYKRNETSLEATNDQFIELTLKPDMTYHILEKATLENENYFLAVVLNETEEPSDDYIVLKEKLDNDKQYVIKVEDANTLAKLVNLFTISLSNSVYGIGESAI